MQENEIRIQDFKIALDLHAVKFKRFQSLIKPSAEIQRIQSLIKPSAKMQSIIQEFKIALHPTLPLADLFIELKKTQEEIAAKGKILHKDYTDFENNYYDISDNVKIWFNNNGYLFPDDFKDFFRWYFKNNDWIGGKIPKIKKEDFAEYAKYAHSKLESIIHSTSSGNDGKIPEIVKSDGTTFSLKEIAYLHFYNKDEITKNNCDAEAKKYGWSSGHRLIQNYGDAIKRLDTKGLSDQALKNRIKLINSIIDYVKPEKQNQVKDDLRKLDRDLEAIRGY